MTTYRLFGHISLVANDVMICKLNNVCFIDELWLYVCLIMPDA